MFDAVVDRARSRLDVPKSAPSSAPRSVRAAPASKSSTIEAAIETPTYDLTVFKLNFGRLTGKAYTKDDM